MLPARAHGIRHAEVGEYEYIGELAVEPQSNVKQRKGKSRTKKGIGLGKRKRKQNTEDQNMGPAVKCAEEIGTLQKLTQVDCIEHFRRPSKNVPRQALETWTVQSSVFQCRQHPRLPP